jgi:ABC-type multidrug transport system ATPase subunit
MIRVDDLTLTFDDQPLYKGFSLQVEKGEKVTLAGESGTGKTTFIHMLLGFIPPQQGRVSIMGRPLNAANIGYIRANTAYVPQELHLPMGTAGDFFYMPFTFRENRDKKPDSQKTHKILNDLGLQKSILKKNLDEISGGQKQRLAIASALLLDKTLLILDEPTSSLDGKSIQKAADLIFPQKELTVLSTSHNKWWIEQSDKTYNLDHHGTNA